MRIAISNRSRQRRWLDAFTFVELMVGTCIILLSFLTIFGGMSMGFAVTQLTRENLRATQIMLDKMEGVRLYNWSQVNDTTFLVPTFTNWFFETNNIGQVNAQGNGITYTGIVTVASFPWSTSYQANARKVTVTVGWVSGNVQRTRSMSTVVSLMGMQNYVYGH
jgi:type II secretory pathway pseudopilin PulG